MNDLAPPASTQCYLTGAPNENRFGCTVFMNSLRAAEAANVLSASLAVRLSQ